MTQLWQNLFGIFFIVTSIWYLIWYIVAKIKKVPNEEWENFMAEINASLFYSILSFVGWIVKIVGMLVGILIVIFLLVRFIKWVWYV